MNSPFANIYLSLITQLNTLVAAPPVSGALISFIDLDYGQLAGAARSSVTFPCVLIDFKDWEFTNVSQSTQQAAGLISIRLAVSSYDDTSSITPGDVTESGLSVLDTEWQLYNALQGFSPVFSVDSSGNPTMRSTPMNRISLTTDNRHPGIRIREMYFSTAYTDFSAKLGGILTPATINLTAEFQDPV